MSQPPPRDPAKTHRRCPLHHIEWQPARRPLVTQYEAPQASPTGASPPMTKDSRGLRRQHQEHPGAHLMGGQVLPGDQVLAHPALQ